MKFGPVPVAQAEGAILAHSLMAGTGRISKGTVLTQDHLAALTTAGHDQVTVARLESEDVHEDAAAARLAAALVLEPTGAGLRVTKAATGRVNLYAERAGIAQIDVEAVHALNAVHPMITLATLLPHQRVEPGTMVGTVKIIAYGVPEAALRQAEAHANAALTVRPSMFKSATLIETATDEKQPPVKGREVLAGRLHRLDVTLTDRVVVSHAKGPLAEAVADAPGQIVFVLTGSATSDAHDVGPEAVRDAGGELIYFGMPVDPGNLLFLGRLDTKPVIGLPGCARSPALNGADWVLERVICGVDLGPTDFAKMGVGGLLKEIPSRPKPRGDIESDAE